MRNIWIFLIILFVFAYFIFPYDLIPDFFGLFGRIDDFSLLGLLIWSVRRLLLRRKQDYRGFYQQNEPKGGPYYRNSNRQRDKQYYERQEKAKTEREKEGDGDPYIILNVSRHATKDEIKRAYKELIKKYHPDKVAYLGEEFQKIAHKKMVDIQKAYEMLIK